MLQERNFQVKQPGVDLKQLFPSLDEVGMDLLKVRFPKRTNSSVFTLAPFQTMLQYDPSRRITAKEALQHPYFNFRA